VIKKLMAGMLLAAISVTAVVPAAVSAAPGGSDADRTVARLVAMNEKNNQFDTLIAAAVCTGVAGILDRATGYTLFAPTDGAFARAGLDASNVCDVEASALADILAYHVYTGGEVKFAAALTLRGNPIPMLNGDDAQLAGSGKSLTIDGANVIHPDIESSNAIIHVINSVIFPPAS
jgi:transforming growth factor-beta-induced protein